MTQHGLTILMGLLGVLASATAHAASLPEHPAETIWSTQQWPVQPLPPQVDRRIVADLLRDRFTPVQDGAHPDTRALLIVHQGAIVLETYAPGFGPTSRFMSWSMAKSVTNALVGILVADGTLALDRPAPIALWRDDPRSEITLRHLLNMTSGLDNADRAPGAISFVSDMLFGEHATNVAAFAADVPLAHPPGAFWAYSTATSNILGALISGATGGSRRDTAAFARQRLFEPLGMRSMELEFDMSGTFVGGVFTWASARDWARLGYLYLRDGVWDGIRVLPEGWVEFTRTPAPPANNRLYGAHFWVSGDATDNQTVTLPADLNAFYMNGAQGQLVVMVPDRDLIFVRLGEQKAERWPDTMAFAEQMIRAFPRVMP